jgi:hypothetical protein
MTDKTHQKAFSLLLLSEEGPLLPPERLFLEGHLRDCEACKALAGVHRMLQEYLPPSTEEHTGPNQVEAELE